MSEKQPIGFFEQMTKSHRSLIPIAISDFIRGINLCFSIFN